MKFSIGILMRDVHPHVACFEDVAQALKHALRDLGHEVVDFGQGGRIIAFGCNNAFPVESANAVPDDMIVFNTEQMTFFGGNVGQQMWNLDRWRKHVIWDYSSFNMQKLREAGAERVVHCPIGYHKSMTFIKPAPIEDIDVLFYGSVNPRRREVLEALDKAGIKVEVIFGVYGKERDAYIARSKIVLNIHHMNESIFEIFRVSHLLANRKCVVSEDGGKDAELEVFAHKATTCVSRDKIVETCQFILRKGRCDPKGVWAEEGKDVRAARGFLEFATKTSLVDNVRRALEQS